MNVCHNVMAERAHYHTLNGINAVPFLLTPPLFSVFGPVLTLLRCSSLSRDLPFPVSTSSFCFCLKALGSSSLLSGFTRPLSVHVQIQLRGDTGRVFKAL